MIALVVITTALAVDLWTKAAAWDYFGVDDRWVDGRVTLYPQPMPHVNVIPSGLDLTAVANQGAAMGLGQGKRSLFLIVGVVAVVAVSLFFAHSLRGPPPTLRSGRVAGRVYRVTLALLLAGIVGNLYDRVVHGYVRDMLHMLPGVRWSSINKRFWDSEVFPWVFNFADVYLCVGVGLILVLSLVAPEPPKQQVADGE